jgi:hypothetical protein
MLYLFAYPTHQRKSTIQYLSTNEYHKINVFAFSYFLANLAKGKRITTMKARHTIQYNCNFVESGAKHHDHYSYFHYSNISLCKTSICYRISLYLMQEGHN